MKEIFVDGVRYVPETKVNVKPSVPAYSQVLDFLINELRNFGDDVKSDWILSMLGEVKKELNKHNTSYTVKPMEFPKGGYGDEPIEEKKTKCRDCAGTGYEIITQGDYLPHKCDRCKGTGTISSGVFQASSTANKTEMKVSCPECTKKEEPKFYIGEMIEYKMFPGAVNSKWEIGYYTGKVENGKHIVSLNSRNTRDTEWIRKVERVHLKQQYLTLINLLPKRIMNITYEENYIATDEDGEVHIYNTKPIFMSSNNFYEPSDIKGNRKLRIGYINLELAKVDWKDSCMKLSDVMVYE
jgi:predicted Zn-ribbon and HTH transcriptional regulator